MQIPRFKDPKWKICKGDSFGKITFHGKQGISTVDYIIVSHNLTDKFQNFVVRQPSPFSDHSQLISWIKVSNPSFQPPLLLISKSVPIPQGNINGPMTQKINLSRLCNPLR